jgi:hypothetical protein
MNSLFCSYRNCSARMLIVRCCGPEDFYLERVVFPFELLTFQCPPSSDVEIWARDNLGMGVVLTEQLSADAMVMQESEAPQRPEWLPQIPTRAVGVRGNASSVCLEPS